VKLKLIEKPTTNADPIWTWEKAKKKKEKIRLLVFYVPLLPPTLDRPCLWYTVHTVVTEPYSKLVSLPLLCISVFNTFWAKLVPGWLGSTGKFWFLIIHCLRKKTRISYWLTSPPFRRCWASGSWTCSLDIIF
jgi:hypothetical protein